MRLLSSIFYHAVRNEVIVRNPVKRIKPNPTRKMTRFLSGDERIRLLSALDSVSEKDQVKADAIRMLLFTGCRRGEITQLRWDEVGESTLNLSDSKTGARTIWLGEEALGILERQRLKRGSSSYVFPDRHKSSKSVHVEFFWIKIRAKVKLDDVRIHDLRHSFASEAVRQGISLPVVSKLLGHSNIEMTMRYTHLSTEDIEAAAERIGLRLSALLSGVG
jgi:integrase